MALSCPMISSQSHCEKAGQDEQPSNKSIYFSQFYSLRYKQGLRISTAGCGMRNTEQDVSNNSVLESIALTRGGSSLE